MKTVDESEIIVQGETSARMEDEISTVGEKFYLASQWQLMWWRFLKHKLAIAGGIVVIIFYLIAAFCEFTAPYPLHKRYSRYSWAPPQRIHLFDDKGAFHIRPFVYGLKRENNPVTWRRTFKEDRRRVYPIYLFLRGEKYKLWGLFEWDIHLFGVKERRGTVFLLGTDKLGRDMLSRIFYGARISLSIGLVGVFLSLVIGVILGGISGYYAGVTDTIIQRLIELLRSFPSIPLWMSLGAALPPTWSPLRVYFGITLILSVLGWTGLARVVRGKLLSLREEDFAAAARLAGAKEIRIIVRHLLPSFLSHIIVTVTLAIPGMILAETALSFLGIGLRPPVTSWGVLLKEAQNVQVLAHQPWLLIPAFFVIITVLAFNFVGDGLRDAADPYAK